MDRDDVIVKRTDLGFTRRGRLAFARALQEVVGDAKENAPVGMTGASRTNIHDTHGGLRASITATAIVETPAGAVAMVGSGVRHAAMREFGGTIRPVRKPRLSWIDPRTGRRIVLPKGRAVTQLPGGVRQGRKPWLRPAAARFGSYMDAHLKRLG